MDKVEHVSLVCELFCDGYRPAQIGPMLTKKLGIHFNREEVYRSLAYAAERRWIRFVAPTEYDLGARLHEMHPWLDDMHVAHTASFSDVAAHTADVLLTLIQERVKPPHRKRSVHVGFAGGYAMRSVARNLAELLSGPTENVPERIVFHALASGFNVHDPTSNPNAFFTYFVDDPAMSVEVDFVGLLAPPVVQSIRFDELKAFDIIEEAFDASSDLDIIVTSGGSWDEPCDHSMLRSYMKRSPASLKILEDHGCRGDLLWRPINDDGPIEVPTEIRAMTLVELSDLSKFIADGNAVLLMLGPCRVCNQVRVELLRTILSFENHLVSHVVTDSRTAGGLVGI